MTMRDHAGVRVVVNVVAGVHPGVQPLLNLPHVLSGSCVKVSHIKTLPSAVTDGSQPVPGVVPHHVVLHPGVLLPVVGLPDVGLMLVTESFGVLPMLVRVLPVALSLPLPPTAVAPTNRVLDPKLGGEVATVLEPAGLGHGTDVVPINRTTSTDVLSVVGTDDVGRGCGAQNGC